jgi:hypothetical protein
MEWLSLLKEFGIPTLLAGAVAWLAKTLVSVLRRQLADMTKDRDSWRDRFYKLDEITDRFENAAERKANAGHGKPR